MEKRQVSLNVAPVVAEIAQVQLAPQMVNDLMVAGGGIAIKSLNPSVADSLEMDLYHAVKGMCSEEDVQHYMQILAKIVVALKPLLTDVNLEGQWSVTGELLDDVLELHLEETVYVEPVRTEMRRVLLDYTTLGLIEKAESTIAMLGGIEDRERFNKLLVSSHSHFTNNGRHNPLAVARDILGNFYASIIAIKGADAQPLALVEAQSLNTFLYDFVGLLSVEVQKVSMEISEQASAIVEGGGNVQITLLATAGEAIKDDLFEILIEEVQPA